MGCPEAPGTSAWAGNAAVGLGQPGGGSFFTADLLLSEAGTTQFQGQERRVLRTESPGGHDLRASQKGSYLPHPVSGGQGSYIHDLEQLNQHLVFSRTYLPTINLIVFVQTPFKARAKDTATKQNQQTEK